MVEPPCTTSLARAFSSERAGRADEVDAEMLEEAPVLGGERGLDQIVGNLLERHGVVVQDAALADLVAVAVEELDAILAGEVDLALRDLEGRQREGGDHEQSANAERQYFAGELVEGADEALDLEFAEKRGVRAPPVAEPRPGIIQPRIDPGIDLEPID